MASHQDSPCGVVWQKNLSGTLLKHLDSSRCFAKLSCKELALHSK